MGSPSPEFSPARAAPWAALSPVLRLVLAVVVLTATLRALHTPPLPVFVLPARSPRSTATLDNRLELPFQSTLTADDVARGVCALAQGRGPGLSPQQRAALIPLALRGQQARVDVDVLRTTRRLQRSDLRTDGLALLRSATALGWRPGGSQ